MKADVETLVGLAVRTAKFDKDGGRTDVLLGQIEGYVVGECDDPSAYGTIGMKMFEEVQDLPVPAVLVQLATLCGIRRLPPTDEREHYLLELIADLERAISILPDSPMKSRCRELFSYHQGIFYGDYGYFDKAAEMQRRSEEEAIRSGNLAGAAISFFMESLYTFKQDLANGAPGDLLELISRQESLVEAIRGHLLEVSWVKNVLVFMIQVHVWLDIHFLDSWVEQVIVALDKLGESTQFINALHLTRDGLENDRLLEKYVKTEDIPERIATAYLVLIRHAIEAGDLGRAKALLDQMPKDPSAKHVRAVAQRLFENK
jgi:hypothetical protein